MANKKILVVDDEFGLRTMLAANLEMEGFDVVEAENAERALELVKATVFELVITDIRMPGMNGVELFRTLRAQGLKMPVVLMTGFATEGLVQGALEDGAFTVLAKPFDVGHAMQTISNATRAPMVLVVDDMHEAAESTRAALEASGLRACAVTSGEAALEALKSNEIDLCVVDLVMPGMSGVELATQIRKINPNIWMVGVSGHDVPEMVRQVAAQGLHTFMRKPFAVRDLVRTIATARGAPKGGAGKS